MFKSLQYLAVIILICPASLFAANVSIEFGGKYINYAEISNDGKTKFNSETGVIPTLIIKLRQQVFFFDVFANIEDSYGTLHYKYYYTGNVPNSYNRHNIFNANIGLSSKLKGHFNLSGLTGQRVWTRNIDSGGHETYKNKYWLVGPNISWEHLKTNNKITVSLMYGKTFDASVEASGDSNIYLPKSSLGDSSIIFAGIKYQFNRGKYQVFLNYWAFRYGHAGSGFLELEPNSKTYSVNAGFGFNF